MTDRALTEATLYRAAVAAIAYYPDRAAIEPDYTLDEDLRWCLEPLSMLSEGQAAHVRTLLASAITDPTAGREALIRELNRLANDSGS